MSPSGVSPEDHSMHCFYETWNILANMVHAVMLSPVCFYLEEQVPALWFAAVPPLQVAFSVPVSLQGCAVFCSILIPPQLDVRLGWRVARLGLFAHSFNHARLQQNIAREQFLQCLSDGRLRALGNVLSIPAGGTQSERSAQQSERSAQPYELALQIWIRNRAAALSQLCYSPACKHTALASA